MTLQLTLKLAVSGSIVESPSYDLAYDLKAGRGSIVESHSYDLSADRKADLSVSIAESPNDDLAADLKSGNVRVKSREP